MDNVFSISEKISKVEEKLKTATGAEKTRL